MFIAIDARELCGRPTGVGRYLGHLLRAWDALPEARAHRFALYVPAEDAELRQVTAALTGIRLDVRVAPGGAGTWWEQVALPLALRRERPDVLFSPAYTAPVWSAAPVALTIHDLSFVAHPEWFPPRSRMRRRLVAAQAARRARLVITDAAFSKAEVVRLLGVPRSKVRVIPLGVTQPKAAFTAAPTMDTGRAPVVLFVGSIFNRRHLPDLIRAFARVAPHHPGLRLEIVGDNRTHPRQDLEEEARRAGVAEATTIRSYVPDDVLEDLYARAALFVFLSDYEGFGLTPLEALASGVPILVGDTPVAREVYGDAAEYVSTHELPAIACAMDRLLDSGPARSALLARAPTVLSRYSWERAGRETLEAIQEAARG